MCKLKNLKKELKLVKGDVCMAKKIKASEISVSKLFSSKRFFYIPEFQRPFSWEKGNFEKLFEDIQDEIMVNIDGDIDSIPKIENDERFMHFVENLDPYFIGSVILQTDELDTAEARDYGIVDGQQRIISVSNLLAVLRDRVSEFSGIIQNKLYQEANPLDGIPAKPRINLESYHEDSSFSSNGETLKDFYQNYILEPNKTEEVLELDESQYKESIQRMIESVRVFINGLKSSNEEFINLYLGYLLRRVILVETKTTSESSAFQLFNVLNTRGMSLSNADILKSLNLRSISSDKRAEYARVWEQLEEEFSSDKLERIIGLMRTIKVKEKAQQSIHEEFEEIVFSEEPSLRGENFIKELQNITDIYRNKIYNAELKSVSVEKKNYYYNLVSLMLDYIPYKDWMAAAIKFCQKFDDEEKLYQFMVKYEAKLAVDWIGELSFNDRLKTIYDLIKKIENSNSPNEVLDSSILNEDKKQLESNLASGLNHHGFYRKGSYQKPKYVLLRIDLERHYSRNKQIDVVGNINVEHVLPQTPTADYWTERFNEQQQREWKHKLGNLTLLDERKNYQVSNKPFPEKVEEYFLKKSEFFVTQELENYVDWNLMNLKERHNRLIEEAKNIWA